MSQKEIEITIFRDGTSKVDAKGFAGVGCQKATEAIEVALGGLDPANRSDSKKPDFYATTGNTQTQKY
jgi:hypothetical protein